MFDRAAYDQRIHALRDHVHVTRLRGMARFLLVNAVMALRFYYTMAMLIDSLADIRDAQQRLHQAQAARDAARDLRGWRPPAGPHGSVRPELAGASPYRSHRSAGLPVGISPDRSLLRSGGADWPAGFGPLRGVGDQDG